MIEEVRRPNPRSRGERTRRRMRIINASKEIPTVISPLSVSPTKLLVQLENHRNNNNGPQTSLPLDAEIEKKKSLHRSHSLLKLFPKGKHSKKTSDPSLDTHSKASSSRTSSPALRNQDGSQSVVYEVWGEKGDPAAQATKKRFFWTIGRRSSKMSSSQSQGAIPKKDRSKGKASTSSSSTSTTPPPPPPVASTSTVEEDKNKEEENKAADPKTTKVSGDDLRKQLTEGLKANGSKLKEQQASVDAGKTKQDQTSEDQPKRIEEKPATVSFPIPQDQLMELPPTEGKREHLYKILVIGELGTGKTSIIKRYVHQFFSQHYRATIGVDFALKVLNWDDSTIIRLQLWDIAGQERFGNMTRVYYKEAVGAFVVFDVTRAATFEAVLKWKQDLDSKVQLSDGSPIPCILLANKCDQPKEGIVNNSHKMDEFCKEKGFTGWFETSAKENINIDEAARTLVIKILQNDNLIRHGGEDKDGDRITLDGASQSEWRGCSC